MESGFSSVVRVSGESEERFEVNSKSRSRRICSRDSTNISDQTQGGWYQEPELDGVRKAWIIKTPRMTDIPSAAQVQIDTRNATSSKQAQGYLTVMGPVSSVSTVLDQNANPSPG